MLANLQRRFDEYERRRREQGRTTERGLRGDLRGVPPLHAQTACDECGGTRLRKEARNVKVGGKTIIEMTALTIREAHDFLTG